MSPRALQIVLSKNRFTAKVPPPACLTLRTLTFSSGIPNQYEVVGLPDNQKAYIALRKKGNTDIWKIKRSGATQYRGSFSSEEAALAALQAEFGGNLPSRPGWSPFGDFK